MKILVALTYYRPHVSGLTIYVERLARSLAARGHVVTVLTSQYDPKLPRRETLDGVHVIRMPVAARVSKGVIMPTIGWEATRQVKANPQTAAIPVIALTAHAMVEDRQKAMAAGCDDFDTKPIELPRLLEKIKAQLATKI